ncbi:MAG TPA: hypothetical protein VGL38_09575 [bacterium]|jgi:hypothetical protein
MTDLLTPSDSDDTENIGIFPLNIDDEDELATIFDRPAPNDYMVVLTLLCLDPDAEGFARDWLKRVLDDSKSNVPKVQLPAGTHTLMAVEKVPSYLDDVMSEGQKKWIFKGVYVQCGFVRHALIYEPHLVRGIMVAMSWYDARVELLGSLDPSEMKPTGFLGEYEGDPIPRTIARTFRLTVNDLYREGVGVWCRDLINIRNEILIKYRASLTGTDPETEWKRFQSARMKYFLDTAYLDLP